MAFQMQLLFTDKDGNQEWASIRPTGGKPYEYDTKEEAESMLDTCYPLQLEEHKRIVEV